MAIVSFKCDLKTSIDETCNKLRAFMPDGKPSNEIYQALDALKVWQDYFEVQHGALLEVRHHSNPDDPPDMEIVFERTVLTLEHTQLKPHPFGMVDAIHLKECPDQCITLPALARRPQSRKEIIDAMFDREGDWAPVAEDDQAWLNELQKIVVRKTKAHLPDVLLIQDTSLLMPGNVMRLAKNYDAVVQGESVQGSAGGIVLLHSRVNSFEYSSFIIRRGEQILSKRERHG